jgi:hypothetical protein
MLNINMKDISIHEMAMGHKSFLIKYFGESFK